MAWEVVHNAGFIGRNWIVTCFPKDMIYPFYCVFNIVCLESGICSPYIFLVPVHTVDGQNLALEVSENPFF